VKTGGGAFSICTSLDKFDKTRSLRKKKGASAVLRLNAEGARIQEEHAQMNSENERAGGEILAVFGEKRAYHLKNSAELAWAV